jgi:adenosylcobinamide-GDP ribazoletransferase
MPILLAFKFLTTLPIPLPAELPPNALRRALPYYPLVGVVLGLLLAGANWVLAFVFPAFLRGALLLTLWVILTGALHLDGFLDCCDGLLAPVTPERRLEILHDVHAGSFAVVGGVLLLLVKFAALLALLDHPVWLAAIVVTPVLARWAMTYAVVMYPYARAGAGLGRLVKEGSGWRDLLVPSAIAILVAGATLRWWAPAALVATWLFTLLVARWITRRIPGLTGDTYGAICELTEVAALLAAAVYAGLH